jgi:homoserine kinase
MEFAPFYVTVPATTANLGPGFDCLGLALSLYNRIEMSPAASLSLRVEGEGEGHLAKGGRNLIWETFSKVFRTLGKPPPPVEIVCQNRIPLARGLGSSAAARIGALLAANHCAGNPFSKESLLEFAVREEGHPDNVAPALLGGLVVCGQSGDHTVSKRIDPAPGVTVVLLIPERTLATSEARRVLPLSVPLIDAVANLQNTALTALAFATGDYQLLECSLADRLHQPYREPLMPGFSEALAAATGAGGLGAALSGAGPSIAAFTRERGEEVGRAMLEAYLAGGGGPARTLVAEIDRVGAQVNTF